MNSDGQLPLSASSASTFSKSHSVRSSRAAPSTIKTYINTAPRTYQSTHLLCLPRTPLYIIIARRLTVLAAILQHGPEMNPPHPRSTSRPRAPHILPTRTARPTQRPSSPLLPKTPVHRDGGRLHVTVPRIQVPFHCLRVRSTVPRDGFQTPPDP